VDRLPANSALRVGLVCASHTQPIGKLGKRTNGEWRTQIKIKPTNEEIEIETKQNQDKTKTKHKTRKQETFE
jgi:hypothetical protein